MGNSREDGLFIANEPPLLARFGGFSILLLMTGTRKHLTESLYHRCVAETISSLKNVVH